MDLHPSKYAMYRPETTGASRCAAQMNSRLSGRKSLVISWWDDWDDIHFLRFLSDFFVKSVDRAIPQMFLATFNWIPMGWTLPSRRHGTMAPWLLTKCRHGTMYTKKSFEIKASGSVSSWKIAEGIPEIRNSLKRKCWFVLKWWIQDIAFMAVLINHRMEFQVFRSHRASWPVAVQHRPLPEKHGPPGWYILGLAPWCGRNWVPKQWIRMQIITSNGDMILIIEYDLQWSFVLSSFPDKIMILRWKKLEAWSGCHSVEHTMSENKLQEKKTTSGSHIPALGTSELPRKWQWTTFLW